jgi:hypothetical protein
MGYRTDYDIAQWQEKSGIKPATGKRAELLRDLSNAAFEAIKTIELELSGIRDGDGYWHGADVIGHTIDELAGLLQEPIPFPPERASAEHVQFGHPDCPVCKGEGWRTLVNLEGAPEDEQFEITDRCPCHIHVNAAAKSQAFTVRTDAFRALTKAEDDFHGKCLGEGWSGDEMKAAEARHEQAIKRFIAAHNKYECVNEPF